MDFNIKKISKDTKCWVVRCDGGQYFKHFKLHSQIAIGHIDYMEYDKITEFMKAGNSAVDEIIKYLIEKRGIDEKTAKRIASSDVSQAHRFIELISEDDFVITTGENLILIGRVKKDAYFDKQPLLYTEIIEKKKNGKAEYEEVEYKMDLTLRRDVEWIAEVPKRKAPLVLQKMLISPLTVFNIRNPKIVYHTIYPMFIYDEKYLHFSIFIQQNKDIKNTDMINLLSLLGEVESICIDESIIDEIDKINTVTQPSSLNIKASFMSPGEVFAFLTLADGFSLGSFYITYSFLFGNKLMGIDGVIPKEARVKIIEHFLEARKESVKRLNLTAPNYLKKKKKKK